MREFSSLADFAFHLAGLHAKVEHRIHESMVEAAPLIEAEAKAELGTYQGAAGPFAAWQALADVTVAERARAGVKPNDPLLISGELRDSIHHQVEGAEAAIGSDSDVAVYQELGTEHIPARSFLGHAAVVKGPEVARILGEGVVSALVGEEVRNGRIPISE